jgi:membrane protein
MEGLTSARPVQLLIRTGQKWQKDACLEMGASMAYYAVFSLFPLVLVILSVFGFFVGPTSQIYDQILTFVAEALPPDAADLVANTLTTLNAQSRNASIIGFGTLLLSASAIFGALDRAFDKIWEVSAEANGNGNILGAVLTAVWKKALAFLLVLGCGGLVLLSMLSDLAIGIAVAVLQRISAEIEFIQLDTAALIGQLQVLVSFLVLALVLMILYRVLPSGKVRWGDVWPGGLLAAGLMILLQQLVSTSVVSVGANFQSYGVIGGVMVLMLWIFLTGQILFIGAELSFAYAHLYGSRHSAAADEASVAVAQETAVAAGLLEEQPAAQAAVPVPPHQPTPPIAVPAPAPAGHPSHHSPARAAGIGVIIGALGTIALSIGTLILGIGRLIQRVRR